MTKCKRCKALEEFIAFCFDYYVTENDLEDFYEKAK